MTEITANYDEPWKAAISEYFESFLSFFYPEIHVSINWQKKPVSLDKELEQITASATTEKRYADLLVDWIWRGDLAIPRPLNYFKLGYWTIEKSGF